MAKYAAKLSSRKAACRDSSARLCTGVKRARVEPGWGDAAGQVLAAREVEVHKARPQGQVGRLRRAVSAGLSAAPSETGHVFLRCSKASRWHSVHPLCRCLTLSMACSLCFIHCSIHLCRIYPFVVLAPCADFSGLPFLSRAHSCFSNGLL